jgi:hypothetical protein
MQDREVVAAIVAGDPDGIAEAYDRYAMPLYSYCRSLLREPADAADAVQDAFLPRYHSTSVQISGRGASPTSTEANRRAASLRWVMAASPWPSACSRSARLVCSAATRC